MAKKNRKNIQAVQPAIPARQIVPEPIIIYGKVPSGIPIAKPATNIQLIPIVQPVAYVPYSTQSQPLLVMDDDEQY